MNSMQSPTEIIQSFTSTYLGGRLVDLASFDLKLLMKDDVFGCPDRKFDADDTNLMRAVYCIVFGDVWPNLTLSNSGDEKMRGDTMNSSATFFSYPWNDRFTPTWNPPQKLIEKIKNFQTSFHTIGNMAVLPDKRIDGWSINKHRGCHDEWHDYEDRFLAALYKILTFQNDADEDLKELVMLNEDAFHPFFGIEGWENFIKGNMLEYYVDDNFVPIVSSKGYTWWRGGYTNRERFFLEAERYINESNRTILARGKRMIDKIKQQLK